MKNVKDDDRKRKWGGEMGTAYGESEKSKKPSLRRQHLS